MTEPYYPVVAPLKAGFGCRCPRCGRGPLYSGYLTVAEACSKCGLDLRAHDSGDGPAVFIILVLGFAVVFGAIMVEVFFAPPYWVHVALWPPIVIGVSLLALRPLKATLIALQYKHDLLTSHD